MNQLQTATDHDNVPLIANIELTNRCSLRCLYCANRRMKRPRADMSLEVLELTMRRIDEAGIRQVILNTVGETLEAPQLREALEAAKTRGLHVLVSTNGQLLTPDVADLLLTKGCDVIRISVNAADAATYRRLHRGGSLDVLLANVRRLRSMRDERGAQVSIRVRSVLPPNPQARAATRQRLDALWGPLVDHVEYVTFGNMGGRNGAAPLADDRRVRCATMWRGFNVLLDGQIAYCPCDFDGETGVGSLVRDSFTEIWHSEDFRAVRAAHEAGDLEGLPRCASCDATRQVWYDLKEPVVSRQEADVMDAYLDGWRELGVTERGANDRG